MILLQFFSIFVATLSIQKVSSQSFTFQTDNFFAINGSLSRVDALTDGIIPTLANLEASNDWARELVTTTSRIPALLFEFEAGFSGDIEIAMFNCPQWNIGPAVINVFGGQTREERLNLGSITDLPTSCEGLVHLCVEGFFRFPFVTVEFLVIEVETSLSWLHLGEVFFSRGNCPTNLLIPKSALGNRLDFFSASRERAVNGSLLGSLAFTNTLGTLATDGIVPTLTDLGGNNWANQLITLVNDPDGQINIDFTSPFGAQFVGIVEVVLFNCPEWNIGAEIITVTGGLDFESLRTLGSVSGFPTDCGRLLHVCVPIFATVGVLQISFGAFSSVAALNLSQRWVHLGEVVFHEETCPTNLIIDEDVVSFSVAGVVAICLTCGISVCFITALVGSLFLIIASRRRKSKFHSTKLAETEGREKKTESHSYRTAAISSVSVKPVKTGHHVQEARQEPHGRGFGNRDLPVPPLPNQRRQPAALPSRTSLMSIGQQQQPTPHSVEMSFPLPTSSRVMNQGGNGFVGSENNGYSIAGSGTSGSVLREKSHSSQHLQDDEQKKEEVMERREEVKKEGEELLYEDMDEAGGYISPVQVHSNFNLKPNSAYVMADTLAEHVNRNFDLKTDNAVPDTTTYDISLKPNSAYIMADALAEQVSSSFDLKTSTAKANDTLADQICLKPNSAYLMADSLAEQVSNFMSA